MIRRPVVVPFVLAVALAACSPGGSSTSTSSRAATTAPTATPTQRAASLSTSASSTAPQPGSANEARPIMAAYDKLNNRAIRRAAGPTFDPSGWYAVDAGPVLAGDLHDTAYNKNDEYYTDKPHAFYHQVGRAFGSAQPIGGQAPWYLVVGKPDDQGYEGLAAMTRIDGRWLMTASMQLKRNYPLPQPYPAGTVPQVRPADQATAIAAVNTSIDAVTTRDVAAFDDGGLLQTVLMATAQTPLVRQQTISCRPWGNSASTPRAQWKVADTTALQLMPTKGDLLAVANLDCAVRRTSVDPVDPTDLDVRIGAERATSTYDSVRRIVCSLLLVVPEHRKPSVAGISAQWALLDR